MKYLIWRNETLEKNYPSVFSHLHKFYTIQISKKEKLNYKKNELLNEVINKNIIENSTYQKQWKNIFINKLSKIINYEIIDATHGLSPNFGGRIILNKSEDNKKNKELFFFISFITNYYSIQIVNFDKYIISNKYFSNKEAFGIKKIIVSPLENENENLFKEIEEFICNTIDNAKFLPFKFDTIKIENFQVPYKYVKDYSTISDGFFNKGLIFHEETEIIGDIEYKIDNI